MFKVLSNPYYFNSIPWQTRREMLFKLAGNISDQEIATGNKDFEDLLNQGKKLDDLKKEYSSKKKLLKESLQEIPTELMKFHAICPNLWILTK
jgi:hypothetical protein